MIPIVIISGFLGSGKTTFLQHILKEHKSTDKILIIENDFGETSLDAVNLANQVLPFAKLHLAAFVVAYKVIFNKHCSICSKITKLMLSISSHLVSAN